MIGFKKKIVTALFFFFLLFFSQNSYSEDQNVLEIIEIIQKDLKTLEKAVYSNSVTVSSNTNSVATVTSGNVKVTTASSSVLRVTSKPDDCSHR